MKNTSIEQFYSRINKHILLVSAYLEDPAFTFIIKSCRLKPRSLMSKDFKQEVSLITHWIDEHGNSLVIDKKSTMIIINDLSVDKSIGTDLLGNVSISDVGKISKLCYFARGTDEDIDKEQYVISFLGHDNYFRTFIKAYGVLAKCSTLLLGIDTLKYIYANLDSKEPVEIDIKNINHILPCKNLEAWITPWPQQNFISNIGDDIQQQTIKGNII